MGSPEQIALDQLRPVIVEQLDPNDEVLQYLRDKKVITNALFKRIRKTIPRPEQSRLLVAAVKRKEIAAEFIDALEYKGSHRSLAKKLKEKITDLRLQGFNDISEKDCVLYRTPGQIDIMCGMKKDLSAISFKLRELSNEGKHGLTEFDKLIAATLRKYGNGPDVTFQMLDSVTAKNRLYYDAGGQMHPLQQMERLVATVTHSEAASMTYLARKGSTIAMTGDLEQAIQYLKQAKAKSALIKPCKDTGMMMYSFVNVLMQVYEADPTVRHKMMLIDNLREAIEVHFSQTPPKMRDEFSRIFFLKLAFCYLGMGVFGKVINCAVTKDDIDAAQKCFSQIEKIHGGFDNRRTMFVVLARAVMDYHSGVRFYPRAMHMAEEAKEIAIQCGFLKELAPIEDILSSVSSRLVEVMDVTIEEGVGSEESMDIDE